METVVEETSINWWVVVLFILLFLVIIFAIIFFFWDLGTIVKNVPLGGTCAIDNCIEGLVCENSICKQPIGGQCDHITDCTSSATACQNSICVNTPLSGIGGTPPCQAGLINDNGICKVRIGGTCTVDSDCSTGNDCHKGKCKRHRIYSSRSSSSESCYKYTSNNSNSDCNNADSNDNSSNNNDSNNSNNDSSLNLSLSNNTSDNITIVSKLSESEIGTVEESIYNSETQSLASIYKKIRSKTNYNIKL